MCLPAVYVIGKGSGQQQAITYIPKELRVLCGCLTEQGFGAPDPAFCKGLV